MSHRLAFGLMVWMVCQIASPVSVVHAQDPLARAKDLYLSAAYDEALAVLDRMETDTPHPARTEVAEYRVFCLLALNRGDEARKAIEGIVNADPFYRPSEAQTSPRIRSVFQDARKAVLPTVVQKSYAEAKASFDKKDPKAAGQFDRVLTLLDDPDLQGAAALSDLKTVASGFRDLSKAMASAATAPLPSAPPVVAQAPSLGKMAPPAPAPAPPVAAPAAARIKEPVLTPPVVISQPMPRWAPPKSVDARNGFKGAIEVTIDESGSVTSATLRQSVHPMFDTELLEVARTWRYKPAMLNGAPRPYVKVVEIQLAPVR